MTTTITLVESRKWGNTTRREYRIDSPAGWLRFALTGDDPRLASFGGQVWPGEFPGLFKTHGPDKGMCTARSGPMLRKAIYRRLPTEPAF